MLLFQKHAKLIKSHILHKLFGYSYVKYTCYQFFLLENITGAPIVLRISCIGYYFLGTNFKILF